MKTKSTLFIKTFSARARHKIETAIVLLKTAKDIAEIEEPAKVVVLKATIEALEDALYALES